MSDATNDARENIFKEMVPHAKKVLQQQLTNQSNPKLAIQVAETILDRAGQTRKVEERVRTPIVITNSQVQILTQVASEVEARITAEGDLYIPTSKELENGGERE